MMKLFNLAQLTDSTSINIFFDFSSPLLRQFSTPCTPLYAVQYSNHVPGILSRNSMLVCRHCIFSNADLDWSRKGKIPHCRIQDSVQRHRAFRRTTASLSQTNKEFEWSARFILFTQQHPRFAGFSNYIEGISAMQCVCVKWIPKLQFAQFYTLATPTW